MAVYYASKAYVLSFSEALSKELAGWSQVTARPGPVLTGFQQRRHGAGFKGATGRGRRPRDGRDRLRRLMAGRRVVVPGAVNRGLVAALAWILHGISLPRFAASRQNEARMAQNDHNGLQ